MMQIKLIFKLILYKLFFLLIVYPCYGYNSHGYTNQISLGFESGITFYSIKRIYGEETKHSAHIGFPLRLFVSKSAIEGLNYGVSVTGYATTGKEIKNNEDTPAEILTHLHVEGSFLNGSFIFQFGVGFYASLTRDIDDERIIHPSMHSLLGYNLYITDNWYIPFSFRLDFIFKRRLLLLRPTLGVGFAYRFLLN